MRDQGHHHGSSIFLELKLGLVTQFPLDYLHLVCLGVTKKLFRTWCKGKLPYRLSPSSRERISKNLILFRKYFPSEFQRKPRSLHELDHFKGVEFRTLLLYTGPAALCGVLDNERYKHFLLLHSAIYILTSEFASDESWNKFAGVLLNTFVDSCSKYYGLEFVTYNVHSLVHLADDCRLYGNVDNFSTFQFESFMQVIKRMLRSNSFHLEQISKRILEKENCNFIEDFLPRTTWKVSQKPGDNCYLLKNNMIVVLTQLIGNCEDEFKCISYANRKKVNGYPFDSIKLGIFIVSEPSQQFQMQVKKEDIVCKFIRLPYGTSFLCTPLLHSLSK